MNNLSKRKLIQRTERKTNPELFSTIKVAAQNPAWAPIAKYLSGPTRLYSSINLTRIDSETKAGDTVLIIGKVLSTGELTKKVKIVALSASQHTLDKISKNKSEFVLLKDEIQKNKNFEGLKLIR